jgi:hypothetical protein
MEILVGKRFCGIARVRSHAEIVPCPRRERKRKFMLFIVDAIMANVVPNGIGPGGREFFRLSVQGRWRHYLFRSECDGF